MEPLDTKYGHVFVDGEDQYLLVKVLATGSEASAQLVVHVQTGELFVRKVGKLLLDEWQKEEKQDPERILFLLQSEARLCGVKLNTVHLLSAEDVPAPQKRGGRKLRYHRVKYFKFYNGGNLGDFHEACKTRDIAPPPSLICKMIQQVVHALRFMYSMDPYIFHGDLHTENIFLHWDQNNSEEPEFFLGDFGWSTCGRIRADNKTGLGLDISHVWMHTHVLLDIGTGPCSQSILRRYLKDTIEPELCRLAYGPVSRLPDLDRLLKLLSEAPAATAPDMRPFMLTRESHSPPSPLLYDTSEEARIAQGIHGPWHIAQVSLDPSGGKLNIVSMSTSTYHRPPPTPADDKNNKSDSSDSDSSDQWEEISSVKSEDWILIPQCSNPRLRGPDIMAGTCCGRRAARVTTESINQSLGGLEASIQSSGSGAAGLERDPNCGCDPCMCPSDDVPCNARYLGDDLSDQGLQKALDRLIRQARQIQAAQGEACDCADQPPYEEPVRVVRDREQGFFGLPMELRDAIYEFCFGDATTRLLTEVAAVRVRQDEEGPETRIVRNLRRTKKADRRHIFDFKNYENARPMQWNENTPDWEREVAAVTYETIASDDALAEMPHAGQRLSLLCVSKRFREDAGRFFFSRRFRFTHPRRRNRIPADDGMFLGILAADAFFTKRSAYNRDQFSRIELDISAEPPMRDVNDSPCRSFAMAESMSYGRLNFVDGLDRLQNLSNTLRQMPFQHLSLRFNGVPPLWHQRRITDPRQAEDAQGFSMYRWTNGLFNIAPRRRLRLELHFEYTINVNQTFERIHAPAWDAMYMLRIIRSFLLTNAQALGDQYEGIRMMTWDHNWDGIDSLDREIFIECDDEYIPETNKVECRLEDRTFGDGPGQIRPPLFYNWATARPPPEVPPPPPAQPRPPPEPEEPSGRRRRRPSPEREPISVLDEE